MRVIIAGAGIGGLCAAIGLRRAGADVEVYEKVEELREVGAGLSLWANALTALDRLGVGGAVRATGSPGVSGSAWDQNGRVITRVGSAGHGEMIVLHRAELQTILLDAVGPSHVRTGCAVTGFEETATRVSARLSDGTAVSGDLLIGADGLHSAVREQLHGRAAPRYAGYTAWRGVADFDLRPTDAGETWGRGERFGIVPMSRGRVYWFAAANAPEGENDLLGRQAQLLERFGRWHPPIPDVIAATDPRAILRNDIYDRPPLTRWSSARVTLLGDAAHATTPNLGQGACQAMEDAAVLAALFAKGGDVPAVLQRYDALRIPRTTQIVNLSRTMGRIGQIENPLACRLRNFVFGSMPPAMQKRQIAAITTFPEPGA